MVQETMYVICVCMLCMHVCVYASLHVGTLAGVYVCTSVRMYVGRSRMFSGFLSGRRCRRPQRALGLVPVQGVGPNWRQRLTPPPPAALLLHS